MEAKARNADKFIKETNRKKLLRKIHKKAENFTKKRNRKATLRRNSSRWT